MRLFILILTALLPTLTAADTISITVPSAVADVVKKYRVDCAEEGGELELDGDEIFRLRTEEGELAFVNFAQLLSYNIKWSYYAIYHKAVGYDLGHIKVCKDYYFVYFLGLISAF